MRPSLRNTLAVLPLAAACAAFGSAAQAQQVTINGTVENITCTPSVNGGGINGTVTLLAATNQDLPSVGSTAKEQAFTIGLTGCGTGSSLRAKSYFYSTTTGAVSNGKLNLTTGSTGSGWQYELLSGTSGSNVLSIGTVAAVTPHVGDSGESINSGSATLTYRARYYRSGTIGEGSGTATVTYAMYYQ